MDRKPSSLKSRNTKKWTRRRVFKEALATGLSVSGAIALTVDDVSGSGDKISIPVYVNQDEKIEVNADWHDQYIHAREVRDGVSNTLIDRTGIKAVGLDPGRVGGDNPHIVVEVNYDEYAGDIPERVSGVRVDVVERENRYEPQAQRCSDYPREDPFPGGISIDLVAVRCTNSSKVMTNSEHPWHHGWTVSGHCISGCDEGEPEKWNRTDADYTWTGEKIGEELFVDRAMDIAYIGAVDEDDPVSKVVKPNAQWESKHIDGTFAERFLANQRGNEATIWGTSSCDVSGNLIRLHQDAGVSNDDCRDHYTKQAIINTGITEVEEGDSGALMHMPYRDQTGAVGSLSTKLNCGWGCSRATATQGFSIRNKFGFWYQNQDNYE